MTWGYSPHTFLYGIILLAGADDSGESEVLLVMAIDKIVVFSVAEWHVLISRNERGVEPKSVPPSFNES